MDPATEPSAPDPEAGQIRHGCCRRNPTRLDTDERVCRPARGLQTLIHGVAEPRAWGVQN